MDNKTKIGKDVIESLTLGMYEDARFIYREYIQNSADQIDMAVEKGILNSKDQGKIEITIDKFKKSITIQDNATGIENNKVLSVLKNIAQGIKDRTKHKGFRGIGRLGGLAYCDRLIFETSFQDEGIKSTLVWDAKKLREIINNRSQKEDATAVIDMITKMNISKEKISERYFSVTLEKVNNDSLLNVDSIKLYLSMVAPVTYKKAFIFNKKISDKAISTKYCIDEYPIYVNNDQIFKAYTTTIYEGEYLNKKKYDEIKDLEFFELKNTKKELLGWGWYGISNYTKVIPVINTARGIRLRKGNIQIGSEDCLVKLFKEQRGVFYFFGEIIACHQNLIPNARRDYFLENETLSDFEKEVKLLTDKLYKLYHYASKVRSETKKIQKFVEIREEIEEKNKNGYTSNDEKKNLDEKFEELKEIAVKAEEQLDKLSGNNGSQEKIFNNIVGNNVPKVKNIKNKDSSNGKTKYITDELSKFNRKEKKLVSSIFEVIDNILTPDLANNLKFKIKEELQK